MKRAVQIITGISAALVIITGAVIITLNITPIYTLNIGKWGLEEASGLTAEQIANNYEAMVDYNLSWGGGDLVLPDIPMSPEGTQHFREVHDIFRGVRIICIGSAVITIAGCVYLKDDKKKTHFLTGGITTIALPAIAGVFVATAWDDFFVLFHRIFFRNDYWIFDPERDPVIKILPDVFFMYCMVTIIFISLAAAILLILKYIKNSRKLKAEEKKAG